MCRKGMGKTMKVRRFLSFLLTIAMLASVVPSAVFTESAGVEPGFIISNPYENVNWTTFKQYKAGLHTHTRHSDGKDTVRSAAERHYDLDFNIMAVTDHNRTNVTPDQIPTGSTNTSTLSVRRIAEMEAGGPKEDSSTDRSAGGMIFVPGSNERSGLSLAEIDSQNLTKDTNGKPTSHHVNTYWASNTSTRTESIPNMLTRMAQSDPGAIARLNHPGRNTGSAFNASGGQAKDWNDAVRIANLPSVVKPYADLFKEFPSLIGMEIINKLDNETQADRILWDNILKQTMPDGVNVWGFSEDDSHANDAVGFSYNLMLMPELSLSEFRISMETGAFFAFSRVDRQYGVRSGLNSGDTTGGSSSRYNTARNLPLPKINSISVVADTITIDATPPTGQTNTIRWIADGIQIATGPSLNLTAYSTAINSYVRAAVSSPNGVLYTQPFGIQRGTSRPVPILTGVSQPSPNTYTVTNGTPKTEMGLKLPSAARITTSAGVRQAPIKWQSMSEVAYDPNEDEVAQQFTVNGQVVLNGISNTNNLSLGVSVNIRTVNACEPEYDFFWGPGAGKTAGFAGRTVIDGTRLSDGAGIRRNSSSSTLAIADNNLRMTNNDTSNRALLILPGKHNGASHFSSSDWNTANGFDPVQGDEYRVVFNASLSSGTGAVRVRGNGNIGNWSSDISLTTTPRSITYNWVQTSDVPAEPSGELHRNLSIETRGIGTNTLIISGFRIDRAIPCMLECCYIPPCECGEDECLECNPSCGDCGECGCTSCFPPNGECNLPGCQDCDDSYVTINYNWVKSDGRYLNTNVFTLDIELEKQLQSLTSVNGSLEIAFAPATTSGRRIWVWTDLVGEPMVLTASQANLTAGKVVRSDLISSGSLAANVTVPKEYLYDGTNFASVVYILGSTDNTNPNDNSGLRTDVTDVISAVKISVSGISAAGIPCNICNSYPCVCPEVTTTPSTTSAPPETTTPHTGTTTTGNTTTTAATTTGGTTVTSDATTTPTGTTATGDITTTSPGTTVTTDNATTPMGTPGTSDNITTSSGTTVTGDNTTTPHGTTVTGNITTTTGTVATTSAGTTGTGQTTTASVPTGTTEVTTTTATSAATTMPGGTTTHSATSTAPTTSGSECGNCDRVDCDECDPFKGEPDKKPLPLGGVRGTTNSDGEPVVDIFDVLELLKFIVGMNNVMEDPDNKNNQEALRAAIISEQGVASGRPTIFCVLEILKYIVGMDSDVDGIRRNGNRG